MDKAAVCLHFRQSWVTSFFQIDFFSPICVIRPSYKLFLTFIFAFQPYSFFLNDFHVIKTCLEFP